MELDPSRTRCGLKQEPKTKEFTGSRTEMDYNRVKTQRKWPLVHPVLNFQRTGIWDLGKASAATSWGIYHAAVDELGHDAIF